MSPVVCRRIIYVICVCLLIVVWLFCFCFACIRPVSCVPNLAVSLDCPFLIALSVFFSVYLGITGIADAYRSGNAGEVIFRCNIAENDAK